MQTDKQLQEQLIQLGLTKHEAVVYMALLSLGTVQAGPIVKKTKLHRMIVYTALSGLEDKDFISIVRKKRVQLFAPKDPDVCIKRTAQLANIARMIVPQLQQRFHAESSAIDVRTLVGQEALKTNSIDIIESAARQADKTIRIIGGGKTSEVYQAFAFWYDEYLALLKERGVKKKLLAPAEERAGFTDKYFAEGDDSLWRLVPGGLNSPTYTRMTEEMISIEIYKPEIIVIQIKNPLFARSYLESFDVLWNSLGVNK